jgi:hypothetical protein
MRISVRSLRMTKTPKIVFFLFSCLLYNAVLSAPALLSNEELKEVGYTYPTKFGDLKFLENGSLGAPATTLTLAGTEFLKVTPKGDGYGFRQSLMSAYDLPGGIQAEKKSERNEGHPKTKRLIILEGPDGNCIRQLIILDFTDSKPFISERFGYNPDGKACLKFKRATWGKKESYIYLEGPMKYVYYTGGRVIGPID